MDLTELSHHTDRGSSTSRGTPNGSPPPGSSPPSERSVLLRQRPGRDDQRAVQDRADQGPRPLAVLDEVEIATAEWVDWFNHRRLFEYCGDIPPAETEAHYAQHRPQPPLSLKPESLRTRRGGSGPGV